MIFGSRGVSADVQDRTNRAQKAFSCTGRTRQSCTGDHLLFLLSLHSLCQAKLFAPRNGGLGYLFIIYAILKSYCQLKPSFKPAQNYTDRTQKFITLWDFCGVSLPLPLLSKIFSLDVGVFEKFALFHFFNKTSTAELKVVLFLLNWGQHYFVYFSL